MRPRAALTLVSAFLLLAPAALSSGEDANVRVSPHEGGPRAAFAVGFTAPSQSDGGTSYWVSAARVRPREGCTQERTVPAFADADGDRVRVRLKPGEGKRWCRGRYRGDVMWSEGPDCSQGEPCPLRAVSPPDCTCQTGAQFDCGKAAGASDCCTYPPPPQSVRAALSCAPPPSAPSVTRSLGGFRFRVR
jgi:hypothetical protein